LKLEVYNIKQTDIILTQHSERSMTYRS